MRAQGREKAEMMKRKHARKMERTRNHLSQLEERKKCSRFRKTGNKLQDPKQQQGGHLLCQLFFLPRVRMLIRIRKRSWGGFALSIIISRNSPTWGGGG